MRLGFDTERFSREVRESKHSGNLDGPEGGLDALMQAMACEDEIGWRENSTRLILFATDGGYHFANDGRMAGILRPNDEKCHLVNNEYTSSADYDYPSINQVSMRAKDRHVHIIFAVTSYVFEMYNTLSPWIELSRVAKLEADSSNIIELIYNNYQEIRSEVRMQDDAPEDVKIKYRSRCNTGSIFEPGAQIWQEGNVCENVLPGQEVEFELDIQTANCPKADDSGDRRIILTSNHASSSMIIDVKIDCMCDCAKNPVVEDQACNYHGNLSCGSCECNDGFGGDHCECDSLTAGDASLTDPCMQDDKICSGRGSCICGSCQCFDPANVYGKHCQCDRFSCTRVDGKLCSGNGACDCGSCRCNEGYAGDDCACSQSTDTCRPPVFGDTVANGDTPSEPVPLCSGGGQCVCGECVCEGDRYGPYCQECPTCDGKCGYLSNKVRIARQKLPANMTVASTTPASVEGEENNRIKRQEMEGSLDDGILLNPEETVDVAADDDRETLTELVDELITRPDEKLCSYFEDGCSVYFTYNTSRDKSVDYDNDKWTRLRIKKSVTCPEPINPVKASIQTASTVLLVGLVTLVAYKAMTYYQDKQEYSKFLKEVAAPRFPERENPMYKPSTSEFSNPSYSTGATSSGNNVRT